MNATILHQIYNYAKLTARSLEGVKFPPENVANLKGMLGKLSISDLSQYLPADAIDPNYKNERLNIWNPRSDVIRYIGIHEDADLTMCVFALPKGTSIPLHNHPNMTVFSKLLFGSVWMKSFDLVTPQTSFISKNPVKVQLVKNDVVTAPAEVQVVLPGKGNIHSFTALQPTAFFDILMPPYNSQRVCQYFEETEDITETRQKITTFLPIPCPSTLKMY